MGNYVRGTREKEQREKGAKEIRETKGFKEKKHTRMTRVKG